jgi:flagellar biosynthesis protein FlhG
MSFFNKHTAEIEPARVQFIEQTFHGLLGGGYGARATEGHNEILCWANRRLFQEGASVETVWFELSRRLHNTRLIAVASGKGGVGKTTFSVNLAIAFAQRGLRVLLFDADLGMANVHIYAGVNPTATLLDVIDRRVRLSQVLTPGPVGIQMICGASGTGRLADLKTPVLEALTRELVRVAADFDVLVMDTGAGISSAVMHFVALAQEAIVVTTPNLAAILDAYGVIKLAHENRVAARMHVLINQAADENQAVRVQERIAGCTNRFLQFSPGNLGCLFNDPDVEQSNQSRRPLLISQPEHANSRRIAQIADNLFNAKTESQTAPAPTAARTAAA